MNPTLEQMAAEYAELVCYYPIADDPTMTYSQLSELLDGARKYHTIAA